MANGTNDLQSTCVTDDRIATKSSGNVRMQRMVAVFPPRAFQVNVFHSSTVNHHLYKQNSFVLFLFSSFIGLLSQTNHGLKGRFGPLATAKRVIQIQLKAVPFFSMDNEGGRLHTRQALS